MFLFELSDHRLVRVSGRDAERYLQGRITQDVKSLRLGESARSLLLTPQGKIQGQFSILRESDSFLLLSDPLGEDSGAQNFLSALLRFKVADQVEATPVSDLVAAALYGGTLSEKLLFALREAGAKLLHLAADTLAIVIEPTKAAAITQLLQKKNPSLELGSEAERRAQMIWAGIPEFGCELTEEISATEIPYAELISFKKGCYSGQEVVEMSIARGRPNKQLLKFELGGKHELAPKAPVLNSAGEEVGFIASATSLLGADSTFALGFVKTKAAESGDFSVNGHPLSVRA